MSQRPISENLLSGVLPHLVSRELRRQAGQPARPGCPDADVLAAYLEQQLAAAEQHTIVEHLNKCQSCRMSVMLAARAGLAAESAPRSRVTLFTPSSRYSSFLPWGVVGGVAAGLLAAFVLFWQHPPALRPTAAPVQQASLKVPAGVSRAESPGALDVPAPPARERRLRARIPLQQTVIPSIAPVLTAANTAAPAARPSSSAPIRQGFATLATTSRATQNAVLPGMEVASTSLNSDGPSTAASQTGNSLPVSGSNSFSASIPMESSFLGSPVSAEPHPSLASSPAREAAPDRLGFSRFLTDGTAAPAWRISPNGALEHAAGRGLWVRVPLQAASRLVSLTASGAHLWVVSQSGVLYHSADAGQSWHPVHIDLDGHAMQDAIIGIHFADQQQGELMTRSGARWFTLDGGHFWKPVIAPSLTMHTVAGH